MDWWIARLAEGGLSFEAIDTSAGNRRVGVLLCTSYHRTQKNEIVEELKTLPGDPKTKRLDELLDNVFPVVHEEIFERRQKTEYLEGVFLSVLSEFGGRGIAGQLVEAAEKKAQQIGMDLVYICCSSAYSAKVCERRGFELFHSFPCPMKPPHDALHSFLKLL